MRKRNRRRSGFTLIEVLLVAGILALLAAFAIPRLFDQADQAKVKLAEAAVGRNGPIGKSLENYKWDMGLYPSSDEGLAALFQPKTNVADDRYRGPYLEGSFEQLRDPWGEPFQYRSPGDVNDTSYDLWCMGQNREDDGGKGGSDDIKNWIEK